MIYISTCTMGIRHFRTFIKNESRMDLYTRTFLHVHALIILCFCCYMLGVLSVPGPRRNPSLATVVYETLRPASPDVKFQLDQMVVHRLDMATSGVLVYALTVEALKQLHLDFRERQVKKTYEALVYGHLSESITEGEIDVALERDPYNPPFMRIAQDKDHIFDGDQSSSSGQGKEDTEQSHRMGPTHKFFREAPKPSLTTWSLKSHEFLQGRPVTRLELNPLTGRTHQLRVHASAALGPMVGDDIYGLKDDEQDAKLSLCLHARRLCFYHPISRAPMVFEVEPPF